MLRALVALMVALAGLLPAAPARADHGPVIVVPSRPGVPVVINGRDASWCVVEGDWGLYRPGHMAPNVICPAPWIKHHHWSRSHRHHGRRVVSKDPWAKGPVVYQRGYYPAYGTRPERGRHEIEPSPDRLLPEPAESYHRSWSTFSEPRGYDTKPRYRQPDPAQAYTPGPDDPPATIPDPNTFNPPVVVVPHIRRP